MKPIANWVLNNSIKKHPNLHFNKSNGENKGEKMLLLGNYEDIKQIRAFADDLRKLGKKIKILTYSEKNISDNVVYSDNDINWSGVPKSEVIEKRLAEKFDICIFLDVKYQRHYQYILSLLMAEFLIGPSIKKLNQYFDLILETKDLDSYFEQVKFCLKNLNK